MRNHQSRPTRFESFLEVNAILSQLVDGDEDVVVEEIPDTIVLIVIIHQILIKRKSHCNTTSRITLR